MLLLKLNKDSIISYNLYDFNISNYLSDYNRIQRKNDPIAIIL